MQVMVLGGDVAMAQSHAVRRVRRCQVQAFDHYSSGGGTWVSTHACMACLCVCLLVCICMHVHVGMHVSALGQAVVTICTLLVLMTVTMFGMCCTLL